MTPEQRAAFINAQAALFLGELELLKAKGTVVVLPQDRPEGSKYLGRSWNLPLEGAAEVRTIVNVEELQALVDQYSGVLGHNAVVEFFNHY